MLEIDHDDPAHVYSPKGNPSGCDKFYCLERFDADGWFAELVAVRAEAEENVRTLQAQQRGMVKQGDAVRELRAALTYIESLCRTVDISDKDMVLDRFADIGATSLNAAAASPTTRRP